MNTLMRRGRLVAAATAVGLVVGLAAACGIGGGGSKQGLTITVWTTNAAQPRSLNELTAAFGRSHHGPKVTIQSVPQSDYVTKLSVRLAGGDAPDLGWLGGPDVSSFATAGRLVDLAPALRADTGYQLADYVPSALSGWQVGGGQYGVPFSTSPFFTLYNKDIFAKAGLPDPAALAARRQWSWPQLAQLGPKLQATLRTGSYVFESNVGGIYGPLAWTTLDPLLRAYGAAALRPSQ